jgi:hypothetical protein
MLDGNGNEASLNIESLSPNLKNPMNPNPNP